MRKLHKAVQEYKFFKCRHEVPNTFLIYNHLKNDYEVFINFSKEFIVNNCPFYSVY